MLIDRQRKQNISTNLSLMRKQLSGISHFLSKNENKTQLLKIHTSINRVQLSKLSTAFLSNATYKNRIEITN